MSAAERFPDPIVVDELTGCAGRNVEHWETLGKIEALKERITRDRECGGLGWFHVVMREGAPALRLCSIHATHAILRHNAQSCQSVIVKCWACGHRGSSTVAGVELCNRCERPSRLCP